MNWWRRFTFWCKKDLWPWREIMELREDLRVTRWRLQAYLDQEAQHRNKWLAAANLYWGPKPFTDGELATMIHFYNKGYGWHEAAEGLRLYCGYVQPIGGFTK